MSFLRGEIILKQLAYYAQLSDAFKNIVQNGEVDARKLGPLGKTLFEEGFEEESNQCFKLAVRCMESFIAQGRIDKALVLEGALYNSFVKVLEKEEHYYQCFSHWSGLLQDAAKKQELPALKPGQPNRLCFVLQVGVLLGHTEVMLQVIDQWQKDNQDVEIYVAALSHLDPEFPPLIESRHIPFIHFCDESNKCSVSPVAAIHMLREKLQQLEIGTAIWVSAPTQASYALALPMAPQQVMWSLKFHPVFVKEAQHHICGGNADESIRTYNGEDWEVCPFPLTVALKENAVTDIEDIRKKFPPESVILGTLAREEKYNSYGYLSALCSIMSNNPHCHFVWTGRKQPPRILEAFKAYGIEDRCHFVGWVDSNLYADAIDIFLETFPFGCGVTGFQAMGHATPLVSYKANDTLYGYQLEGARDASASNGKLSRAAAEKLPILSAVDMAHYIKLVQRLIDDKSYRQNIGQREKEYYETERARVSEYARRFLETSLA